MPVLAFILFLHLLRNVEEGLSKIYIIFKILNKIEKNKCGEDIIPLRSVFL